MHPSINRRTFIRGAIAAAGFTAFPSFPAFARALGKPNIRIGVLSDVHIDVLVPETEKYFEKALTYFREQGVDGVLIAGDITDAGVMGEWQIVADTWNKVFPDGKGLGGKKVERIFVCGNHDIEGYRYSHWKRRGFASVNDPALVKESFASDRAANWKKLFNEDYEPLFVKDVKGYKFVCAHWDTWKGIDAAGPFIRRVAADFDPAKPFFYAQHPHLKGTIFGDEAWGRDQGQATWALSDYPNALAFSGHSHYSLTNERNIWQGAFTAVGTSSLSYTWPQPDDGRDGVKADLFGDCKQGMVMDVYDDCIVLVRREFNYDQELGPDWVIPIRKKGRGETPYAYDARAERTSAPEFAPGAELRVTKDEKTDEKTGEKTFSSVTVAFPSATSAQIEGRAMEYEVEAFARYTRFKRTYAVKRVVQSGFNHALARLPKEMTCTFSRHELPSNVNLTVSVKAINCWGRAGAPLVTQVCAKKGNES